MHDSDHISVSITTHDEQRLDRVAVEAPLELRVGGRTLTVMMRTPGHDEELIAGFLFSEGIIADLDDIKGLFTSPLEGEVDAIEAEAERAAGGGDLVNTIWNIAFHEGRATSQREWPFLRSSSCGVCGATSIPTSAKERQYPNVIVPMELLTTLPAKMRSAQPLFQLTGGVHASALFTPTGELVAIREDVGRHNALDKIVGWALHECKVPLQEYALLVSGRVSYDIVQKAIVAGITLIAAVGAPSSYAVELARQYGITLVGFLRDSGGNVYC